MEGMRGSGLSFESIHCARVSRLILLCFVHLFSVLVHNRSIASLSITFFPCNGKSTLSSYCDIFL